MATIRITLFKAKALKDGKHKIRIALSHKHHTVYIVTRFVLDSENELKGGMVVRRPDASIINTKLRNLMNLLQERIDEIDYPESYTCAEIKKMITHAKEQSEVCMFKGVADEYIANLRREKRNSYADLIEYNRDEFLSYCNGDIRMELITPRFIEGYRVHLMEKGSLSPATINTQLARTKVIINDAIKRGMVQYPIHPFATTTIKVSQPKERDISIEGMTLIRDSEPKKYKEKVAKDIFLLSFFCGGMNLIDIMAADWSGKQLDFSRQKTKKKTEGMRTVFTIPPEAKEITNKYLNKRTHRLDFNYNYKDYKDFLRMVTRTIKSFAKKIGVEENVSFYSARKTFSQFATDLEEPDSVIDYCMSHSPSARGVLRYYSKVKPKRADKCIEKVIDYYKNPERYADVIRNNE